MKLKIQVMRNHDEFYRQMEQHEHDPTVFSKPEMEIGYDVYNIPDEYITGYRIIEPSDENKFKKSIVLFIDIVTIGDMVADHTEELERKLDDIIELKNMSFREFHLNNK
jgi:hypothetical protein